MSGYLRLASLPSKGVDVFSSIQQTSSSSKAFYHLIYSHLFRCLKRSFCERSSRLLSCPQKRDKLIPLCLLILAQNTNHTQHDYQLIRYFSPSQVRLRASLHQGRSRKWSPHGCEGRSGSSRHRARLVFTRSPQCMPCLLQFLVFFFPSNLLIRFSNSVLCHFQAGPQSQGTSVQPAAFLVVWGHHWGTTIPASASVGHYEKATEMKNAALEKGKQRRSLSLSVFGFYLWPPVMDHSASTSTRSGRS